VAFAGCERSYDVVISSPTGVVKFQPRFFYSLRVALAVNKPGTIKIELPSIYCTTRPGGFDPSLFSCDDRILIMREVDGVRSILGNTSFFLTDSYSIQDSTGLRKTVIEGEAAIGLLSRYINAYDADDLRSDIGDRPSDNAMKDIVDFNLGGAASSHAFAPGYAADPRRTYLFNNGYLTIQAQTGSIVNEWSGDIENANVLEMLQRVAEYSFGEDEPLFFDLIQTTPFGNFEFQTFPNQRGTDRTQATGGVNTLTISPDTGAISEYELRFTCKDQLNRVYVGDKDGQGSGRGYTTVDDPDLTADQVTNPFVLRESFLAGSSNGPTDNRKDGQAELAAKAATVQLRGRLGETNNFVFGRDFDFGDRLDAAVEGAFITVFIDTVTIDLADGEEVISPTFSTDLVNRQTGVGRIYQQLGDQRRLIQRVLRRE